VRRRAVEVKVVLLDILAVIPLAACQSEEAFLEDRVAAVPERQRETDPLVTIADARQTVFVTAVGAR
jgi:hypothetical protein